MIGLHTLHTRITRGTLPVQQQVEAKYKLIIDT